MASYPSEQPNSVRRCNVPTYDDQFSHPHLAGRFSENGAIFQTRQFPSDEVEVEEVIAQESQTQPHAQTTGSQEANGYALFQLDRIDIITPNLHRRTRQNLIVLCKIKYCTIS